MAVCNSGETLLKEATDIRCGRVYPVAKNECFQSRKKSAFGPRIRWLLACTALKPQILSLLSPTPIWIISFTYYSSSPVTKLKTSRSNWEQSRAQMSSAGSTHMAWCLRRATSVPQRASVGVGRQSRRIDTIMLNDLGISDHRGFASARDADGSRVGVERRREISRNIRLY